MKKSIELSANGKLLLTGEYLVITGAEALAFPVRFGQKMKVGSSGNGLINWVSRAQGTTWFTCGLDPGSLEIQTTSDISVANRLTGLLQSAKDINPGFLSGEVGFDVMIVANYPLKWGMGSSSTLISLIAGWAEVDPFRLYWSVSEGSGFDVACALAKNLFFYRSYDRQPETSPASPGKALVEHACFAYLGRKQDSSGEVGSFLSAKNYSETDLEKISGLSREICSVDDPSILCSLIDEHESVMSRILEKERISKWFPGFPGSVKSLGAWGGDFAMFSSSMNNQAIKEWLKKAGLHDVFTYDELRVVE